MVDQVMHHDSTAGSRHSRTKWRVIWGACAAIAWVACTEPPKPVPASQPASIAVDHYSEAQRALSTGDFFLAVTELREVTDAHPQYAKAKSQLDKLQPRVDKLAARLWQRADELVNEALFARAILLLEHVRAVAPDRSAEIEKRLAIAKDRLNAKRLEYEEKLKRALDRLQAGAPREAYQLFARAFDLAEDELFPWSFALQQSFELARAELSEKQQKQIVKREELKRRRKNEMEADLVVAQVDTTSTQEQEVARLKTVRDLLEKSRDLKKKGMTFEAIVALEEARTKDPESNAVKLALEALEDDRLRLIDGYLEIADRHYARQELDDAVPYYKRVLRLEPDNLRAKEAVQMHQNLERIKQERGRAGQ